MKKKLTFLLVASGMAPPTYSGDAIQQYPQSTVNEGSGSVSTGVSVGGYGADIEAQIDGGKTGGFSANVKTPTNTGGYDMKDGGDTTVKIGKKNGIGNVEVGCKTNGAECETIAVTKPWTPPGIKVENKQTETAKYSKTEGFLQKDKQGSISTSSIDEFNRAAEKKYFNNPANQPIKKTTQCEENGVKLDIGVIGAEGSKNTCYIEKTTSAAEQSLCKDDSDDPSCKQPTQIKSENIDGSLSLGKSKEIGENGKIKAEVKVGITNKYNYSPDKEAFEKERQRRYEDEVQGKPGSCNTTDPCFWREQTTEVYGELGLGGEGKVGKTEVDVNLLTIKGKLPSRTYVDTPIVLQKRDYVDTSNGTYDQQMQNTDRGNNSEYPLGADFYNNRHQKERKHQQDVTNALNEKLYVEHPMSSKADQDSVSDNYSDSEVLAPIMGIVAGVIVNNMNNSRNSPRPTPESAPQSISSGQCTCCCGQRPAGGGGSGAAQGVV